MTQYGFYFDSSRCTGCKTCELVCKDYHDLGPGILFRRVYDYEGGAWARKDDGTWEKTAFNYHVALSCNHCDSPACVANCPTGAMYKDEETGVVLHDDEMCIGCETCVSSCPYGEPVYMEAEGIVRKCDSCYLLREKGESPACVAACPMRCLDFGDLEELKAKYGDDLVSDINGLPDSSETTPSLLINARDIAVK